jgi:hypothetical protein
MGQFWRAPKATTGSKQGKPTPIPSLSLCSTMPLVAVFAAVRPPGGQNVLELIGNFWNLLDCMQARLYFIGAGYPLDSGDPNRLWFALAFR